MGRAPTSNNCHTCRQRRVKCDKARPECARCIKGGFTCQGYENVLRMENYAVEEDKKTPGMKVLRKVQVITSFPGEQKPVPIRQRPAEAGTLRRDEPVAREINYHGGDHDASSGMLDIDDPEVEDVPRNTLPNLPPELHLGAFADTISFSYFFRNYGWINMHSIMLQDDHMQPHLTDGGMAEDSLRALAYGLLGRDGPHPSLRDKGRILYGKALRTLRTKLVSASKEQLVRMLKPIAVMGAYSISVENDLRFTHHQGMARILEHCGPEYFQSPETLPIFESCRWTLISNAMVRRESTFLTKPEWKTVPWQGGHTPKSQTMKLLDMLSEVPTLLGGIWMVLADRIANTVDPFALPDDQRIPNNLRRIHELEVELAAWRTEWLSLHPSTAPKILSWSLQRTGDDTYRPGYEGLEGPDAFPVVLASAMDGSQPMPMLPGGEADSLQRRPHAEDAGVSMPQMMQDAALYLTVVVWLARLRKYTMTANQANDKLDFFQTPFHTNCACCTDLAAQQNPNGAPFDECETNPPPEIQIGYIQGKPAVTEPASRWNATTHRIAAAPTRISDATTGALDTYSSSVTCTDLGSPGPHPAALRIPGDIRFAGQLRVLGYLVDRLPATRSAVVGTLAAIGLGHCGHDVRPADGIPEVADTVRRALMDTGVEGSGDLLLRGWRDGDVEDLSEVGNAIQAATVGSGGAV